MFVVVLDCTAVKWFKVDSINSEKSLLFISVAFEPVLVSPTVSTIGYDAV